MNRLTAGLLSFVSCVVRPEGSGDEVMVAGTWKLRQSSTIYVCACVFEWWPDDAFLHDQSDLFAMDLLKISLLFSVFCLGIFIEPVRPL